LLNAKAVGELARRQAIDANFVEEFQCGANHGFPIQLSHHHSILCFLTIYHR
jgi:hypothetical protein